MLYLGGQTVYYPEDDSVYIFVDYRIVKKDGYMNKNVKLYDGNKVIDFSASGLSPIFIDESTKHDRTIYHGDYCNLSVAEGIDEDTIIEKSKEVKKYIRGVKSNIKKGNLFCKNFND